MSIYIIIYKVTRSAGGLAEFSVKERRQENPRRVGEEEGEKKRKEKIIIIISKLI